MTRSDARANVSTPATAQDLSAASVAMASVGDLGQLVIEMVIGHRAQLAAAGFSETAAEMMSMSFYATVVAKMFHVGCDGKGHGAA